MRLHHRSIAASRMWMFRELQRKSTKLIPGVLFFFKKIEKYFFSCRAHGYHDTRYGGILRQGPSGVCLSRQKKAASIMTLAASIYTLFFVGEPRGPGARLRAAARKNKKPPAGGERLLLYHRSCYRAMEKRSVRTPPVPVRRTK
jgi:hypothetical protein